MSGAARSSRPRWCAALESPASPRRTRAPHAAPHSTPRRASRGRAVNARRARRTRGVRGTARQVLVADFPVEIVKSSGRRSLSFSSSRLRSLSFSRTRPEVSEGEPHLCAPLRESVPWCCVCMCCCVTHTCVCACVYVHAHVHAHAHANVHPCVPSLFLLHQASCTSSPIVCCSPRAPRTRASSS